MSTFENKWPLFDSKRNTDFFSNKNLPSQLPSAKEFKNDTKDSNFLQIPKDFSTKNENSLKAKMVEKKELLVEEVAASKKETPYRWFI